VIKVFQTDHSHDIRRIVAAWIWTFFVGNDQTCRGFIDLSTKQVVLFKMNEGMKDFISINI
jgi:hypothetical protein